MDSYGDLNPQELKSIYRVTAGGSFIDRKDPERPWLLAEAVRWGAGSFYNTPPKDSNGTMIGNTRGNQPEQMGFFLQPTRKNQFADEKERKLEHTIKAIPKDPSSDVFMAMDDANGISEDSHQIQRFGLQATQPGLMLRMNKAKSVSLPDSYKSNNYAVKGTMGTAVKTSAGCVWRRTTLHSNSGPTPDSNVHDHPLKHMEHRGIFDSGCSGHMTGNRAHLEDYQELNKVGSVTFGGSKGSISGKGTIRLGNLVFDDVAFVKELGHFNLFSISQICDKKLNVLFTEKECFVVSSDFKMPDENQVLLKVPRQHNMYTFDMKTVDSSKGYTCLLAKASSNEAKLWHRRLGHLNFKNLNKLVKDNLVRGLPSKSFKNDHTCVACQKGKQHKASCKAKIARYVTHPLHTLHMDLFGPTSVRSINHASYCLVITDDCSRNGNMDPIEAARTMLADSLLPTTFWAEAVNTACYIFNRVRVTKPQNKTPYELLFGHKPIISYIRPFGCHVSPFNTLSPLANPAGSKEAIDIDVQTEELLVVSSTSRKAAGSEHNATQQSHSSKKQSSTPISKSADDIMVFRQCYLTL
ncbi:putative ribonuclease H-like domain-containing protein [Tanacetum coccineum]|uniref:Ribonuclease H-like domain-containing protein n=1 Tax=Tanacetum coccineum TaxID=301880 RepID=A0ABQ5EYE3_9ASTR